jgi:hypothetical protein
VKIATLAQSPVFGGRVKSVDDSAAKAVKGVRQIVRLDDAIAVVADHMGAAKKGLAVSTAEQKCARWRRESVPVRLREKGCEAPAICLSARIETRGVIQSLGLASPSRVVFGVAFVA